MAEHEQEPGQANPEPAVKAAKTATPKPKPAPRRGRHGTKIVEVPSTGHSWDGIEEYDNPLPRWWLYTFYATIVWGVIYMILYPAWPLVSSFTPGLLGQSNRNDVAVEIARVNEANASIEAEITQVSLDAIPGNEALFSYARNAGGAVFRTWCAQCHGAGAAGNQGYPNLLDNDWLWGGTLDEIHTTVQHGIRDPQDPDTRYSEMPRFGTDELLDNTQIDQVVNHVLEIAGLPHDAAAAEEGKTVYADNCASCHAEDGTGDLAQGAPDLTDAVWLYARDNKPDAALLTRIIHDGPFGVMPSWTGRLSDAQIREVAVYVHSLGGGE